MALESLRWHPLFFCTHGSFLLTFSSRRPRGFWHNGAAPFCLKLTLRASITRHDAVSFVACNDEAHTAATGSGPCISLRRREEFFPSIV